MKGKRFSAWQIELTTRCPLRCVMCIRNCGVRVQPSDMPLCDLRRIAPYLKSVETAVLEGWGEPLVYKDLVEAVAVVKSAGTRAGFVTSGWGMTDELALKLVRAGLDFIGFSLAGASAEVHESIRVNSSFEGVLSAVECIAKARRSLNRPNPEMHIIFLVLETNAREIIRMPELAKNVGVSTIVAINPILVGCESQEKLRVFGRNDKELETLLRDAQSGAAALGLRLRTPLLSPVDVGVCDENPLANLYISVDGEVSPCVFLSPPIESPFRSYFCGRETLANKLSFGNIFKEPVESIFEKTEYARFRKSWELRRKKFREIYSPVFWTGSGSARRDIRLPGPPEPCRTCHKSIGL